MAGCGVQRRINSRKGTPKFSRGAEQELDKDEADTAPDVRLVVLEPIDVDEALTQRPKQHTNKYWVEANAEISQPGGEGCKQHNVLNPHSSPTSLHVKS